METKQEWCLETKQEWRMETKQAWRTETKQDLVVNKVFRAKYSQNWFDKSLRGQILKISTWGGKSIMSSVMKMKTSVGKIIGDGRTTKILEDNWTSTKTKVEFKERLQGKPNNFELGPSKVGP